MCIEHGLIDLTGRVFGRLVVVERLESHASKTRWLCECECGNSVEIYGVKLREAEREGRDIACSSCKPGPGRPRGSTNAGPKPRKSSKICGKCCNMPWQVRGEQCQECGRPRGEEPPPHAVVTQVDTSANGLYA